MIRFIHARLRHAVLAVVAAVVVVVGLTPGAAEASSGIVYGPWSCGPDQNAGISYWVTGTSGGVGIDMYSSYTTVWGGTQSQLSGAYLPAGSTITVWAPNWGRTIHWFDYATSGNAAIRSYYKDCR